MDVLRTHQPAPHTVEALSQEIVQPSYLKAFKALCIILCIITLGYIGLALAPWYSYPLFWFILGTAITGVVTIANDCENQRFFNNRLLNEFTGTLCLLPLCFPYNTISISAKSGTWLNWGPFWLLRSVYQWMKANFAIPFIILMGGDKLIQKQYEKRRIVINVVCIYGFVLLFFPIMTMKFGVWGIFKFYIIPMIIYHFWMSTCLKLSEEIKGEPFTMGSYPRLIELIGNNFAQLANSFSDAMTAPSYNFQAARKEAKERFESYREVKLSWKTLLSSPSNKNEYRLICRVHDVIYDLTEFKHPGGPISIGLAAGRDATGLFELHHPFTSRVRLQGILNKYKMKDQEGARKYLLNKEDVDSVFEWKDLSKEESGFAKELLTEVGAYFQNIADKKGITLLEATKATPRRWTEMLFFLFTFIAMIPFYVSGYWFTIFLLPFFAWLYAAAISHDAMHFAISTNWKINTLMSYSSPWTASPLMWYHQHVIGHHIYPNVPFRDPDLAHAPGFIRLHDSIKYKGPHKYQSISVWAVWTFGAALYMTVVPIKAIYQGALNRAVTLSKIPRARVVLHVLGRIMTGLALWGWQWYVFQGDLPRQIAFTVVPILVHSFCFMLSTQFNHLTPENITKASRDFYEHQVITSHSFSMKSQLIFWFTGGLNVQIEHHLFPTVNHCHLIAISPIVTRLCKKYNIEYHESTSIFEALGKHFKHVTNMSQRPKAKVQ